jgi:hypothetical protein
VLGVRHGSERIWAETAPTVHQASATLTTTLSLTLGLVGLRQPFIQPPLAVVQIPEHCEGLVLPGEDDMHPGTTDRARPLRSAQSVRAGHAQPPTRSHVT